MTNRIAKLLDLPARDKALLAHAVWLLTLVWVGLRLGAFSRLRAWAAKGFAPSNLRSADPAAPSADQIAHLVAVAAHHHPLPMRCLERSLALQRLLGSHGIAAELEIGVDTSDGTLAAHAWIEVDTRPICEPTEIEERFRTLVARLPTGERKA